MKFKAGFTSPKILFCLIILFLTQSCQTDKKYIPLVFGLSLEKDFRIQDFLESVDSIESLGLNEFGLEIPLTMEQGDSVFSIFPQTLQHLSAIDSISASRKMNWSLSFVSRSLESANTENRIDSFFFSIHALEVIDSCLHFLNLNPPKRIVLSKDFFHKLPLAEVSAYLSRIRKMGKALVSLSIHLDTDFETSLPLSDEITLVLNPVQPAGNKAWFYKVQTQVFQLSEKYKKAVFISKSNLMTDNAAQDLPLFFKGWAEEVILSGLFLNSPSTKICLADDSPYFGRKKDEKFREEIGSILALKP